MELELNQKLNNYAISDLNYKLIQMCLKTKEYNGEYKEKKKNFETDAIELVKSSKQLYQLEDNNYLNKVSLKDYILNSELCQKLRELNISNYTIEQLNYYINTYGKDYNIDTSNTKKALYLYIVLEEMDNIENKKIEYIIESFSNYFIDINEFKTIKKEEVIKYSNTIKRSFKAKFINRKIVDKENYDYFLILLNELIEYYTKEIR